MLLLWLNRFQGTDMHSNTSGYDQQQSPNTPTAYGQGCRQGNGYPQQCYGPYLYIARHASLFAVVANGLAKVAVVDQPKVKAL